MAARLRLTAALCALIAAVTVVWQTNPVGTVAAVDAARLTTSLPVNNVSTTIKWPVVDTVDPRPFDACDDIPYEVYERLGLAFTPPQPEEGLRCHLDAGNYQMAVEAFVWRTFDETIPADALQLDIAGHRAAQYWIMKPTERNDRFWITCMIAFKTDYGVIQQSVFYAPVYSPTAPDCLQVNLQRANELAPYYKF